MVEKIYNEDLHVVNYDNVNREIYQNFDKQSTGGRSYGEERLNLPLNKSLNSTVRSSRPMSKRELYQSIINFRTNVDKTLDDPSPIELQSQPPPVEVPKNLQISTSQHMSRMQSPKKSRALSRAQSQSNLQQLSPSQGKRFGNMALRNNNNSVDLSPTNGSYS